MTVNTMNRSEFSSENWTKPRMIPLEQVFIDFNYQRRPNLARARSIAKNWNPDLAKPITVSRRVRDDGTATYAVVDGQHRYEAARMRGIDYIASYVRDGLTVEDEAKLFHDMNSGQKPTTPRDNFRAEYSAAADEAVKIVNCVRKCGFYVDGTPNWDRAKGRMIPVGVARDIFRADPSGNLLTQTLATLQGSWDYLDEPGSKAINGAMYLAIARIIDRATPPQLKRFRDKMRTLRPEVVEATVITKAAQDQRKVALGSLSPASARPGNTHGEIAKVSFRMALIDLSNSGVRRGAPEYMRQENFV